MPSSRVPSSPFRYFKTSQEVIRLTVLLYVKYPLSLRNAEDLMAERGIELAMRRSATGGKRNSRFRAVDRRKRTLVHAERRSAWRPFRTLQLDSLHFQADAVCHALHTVRSSLGERNILLRS